MLTKSVFKQIPALIYSGQLKQGVLIRRLEKLTRKGKQNLLIQRTDSDDSDDILSEWDEWLTDK